MLARSWYFKIENVLLFSIGAVVTSLDKYHNLIYALAPLQSGQKELPTLSST